MKKIILAILFALTVLSPVSVSAQDVRQQTDQVIQAKVLEIIREQETTLSDGTQARQQDIRLEGLEGRFDGQIFNYYGIGDIDVIKRNLYKPGDTVLVLASADDRGQFNYYVTDYVRTDSLSYLGIIFVVILFAVGGLKGLRSLFSLGLSFLIIMQYIVPQILDGSDPIVVTVIGSLAILVAIIYLTEGFVKEAHIGIVSIFASLLITVFLSWLFVNLAQLSGVASEEVGFLVGLGTTAINFKGLLMAGIIIGALGVLDDVVISQISSVREIYLADPRQSRWQIFRKAYSIGVSHISSMTNTLFLAYAGASLAILILFSSGTSGYSTWTQAINNESLATEIVRTLAGSVGLILAVPIATLFATWAYKRG